MSLQRGPQLGFLPLPHPGLPIPAPPGPTASAGPKRLPLPSRLPQETLAFREELDVLKFLCKDLWVAVFQKQMDSLRTNHQVRCARPGPASRLPVEPDTERRQEERPLEGGHSGPAITGGGRRGVAGCPEPIGKSQVS